MTPEQVQTISTAILDIKHEISNIADKQDEMISDIRDVKSAIYNPDSGLYARLRTLEQWKASQSKIQWGVMMTLVGLVTTTIYKFIIQS